MSDLYGEKMARNESEAQRLDEQFDLITLNIGYLIHPNIAATLPCHPRVADIGTGTGHFLECFQNSQKSYAEGGLMLHGYDMSPIMFNHALARGAEKTNESGISLMVLDIKQPIPEELVGTYDLVHVRLLVAAVLASEWTEVVRNVARLVKPGGWVQWEEGDMAGTKHLRGGGGEASRVDTARGAAQLFMQAFGERFNHGWNTLAANMQAAGLNSVFTDCVSTDRLPETREKMTANGMRVIFAWIRRSGAMKGGELERAEKAAFEEIRRGCYCRFEIYVIGGQKPR